MDIPSCIKSSKPETIVNCLGPILDYSKEHRDLDIMVDINKILYQKFSASPEVIDCLINHLSKPIKSRELLNAASYLCCIIDSYLYQRENLVHPDLVCQYFNTSFINKNVDFSISPQITNKIFDSRFGINNYNFN